MNNTTKVDKHRPSQVLEASQENGTLHKSIEVIMRVANAVAKLTTSASQHIGADCALHAEMGQRLLQEQGISTRAVYGEAAWRVGPGDGDTIVHSLQVGGYTPPGMKAVAYHAWLELGEVIIDFSTHSLRDKAAQLDKMDGGTTTVKWCPKFLILSKKSTKSFEEVTQAELEGVAYYKEIPRLREFIMQNRMVEVAEADMQVLRLIFTRPDIQVIGPNDIMVA